MLVGQLFGGTVHWGQIPVYLAAEILGAIAAGFVYSGLAVRRAVRVDVLAGAPATVGKGAA
jgi:glycerol uptake facilitator protein